MKKKETKQSYNNQSITSLKGADRVRKRPAVIFGSDGLEGCEHSVFEILSNSVDEAREGYGNTINITAFADLSIEVEDFGRGVPLGWNEGEGRYNWELVYSELYAGGKYDNNSDGSAYEFSLGLNGLGACATQYSSEFFNVKSYDGENLSEVSFEKGEAITELTVTPLERRARRTGTVIRWRPDLQVFTDINIPREYFTDMLKRQAVVNSGIKFVFRWEVRGFDEKGKPIKPGTFETEEFFYENGISDYIAEIAGDTAETKITEFHLETKGRDREDMKDYKLIADIAFTVSKTVNALEYYHNSSWLEHGGSPEKAVKLAFVSAVDKRLKSTGKYNKNESKITFPDIEDCLILVTNSFSTQTSYANQTKKAITNTFIADAMTEFLKEQLEYFFAENPVDGDRLCAQVLVNKRSREQSEATRLNLKKKLAASTDVANRVEKFVACRSKDPDVREVYIVEGDSAMSSCKLARDAEFQAIIPVRGKTLNCLKASYDRIFKSDIILDLLRVIGCGVEIQTKHKSDMVPFDINNLRWSKIIICTDADEDGFQIRTLLLTLFYRLLPTLLKEGKVYIAESPLYEITPSKGEVEFAYNEPEKAEIIRKFEEKGVKYTLQRSKGLGENEPDMMSKTTMNPATRRLIRVTPADAAATARIFDIMLGDDLDGRKKYIAEHGHEYLKEADI
ncbi:MAG: DNA topoisomerase [Ruminococcaceae bacterium]|nr:DNA topoisomerase [Oscillospiraceae bacterium]